MRSVLDDGLRPGQILAITFTEKAAGELRARVRARFLELGEREAARGDRERLDLHDPRLLRAASCAATRSPPAWTRRSRSSTRPSRASCARRRGAARYAAWIDDGGDAARRPRRRLRRRPPAGGDRGGPRRAAQRGRRRGPAAAAVPPVRAGRSRRRAHAVAAGRCRRAQAELAAAKPGARVAAAQEAVLAGRDLPDRTRRRRSAAPAAPRTATALERARAGRARRARGRARRRSSTRCSTATRPRTRRRSRARPGWTSTTSSSTPATCSRATRRSRASYAERFARVMVDEFQDSNPRQVELFDLLGAGRRFVVGDELQSIYGFRHADVEVFRGRRADARQSAARRRRCRTNFRSRAGDPRGGQRRVRRRASASGFMPLAARPRGPRPATEPAVELLLTDAEGWDDVDLGALPPAPGLAPRRGAAARPAGRRPRRERRGRAGGRRRAAARRRPLPVFERALRGRRAADARRRRARLLGPPGRARPLRLARRRSPTRATRSRSTACSPRRSSGASTDALALVGETGPARQGRAWQAIADGVPHGSGGSRARRGRLAPRATASASRAFAVALRRPSGAVAPRLGLDELLRAVVEAADYDLHVLSLPGGARRLANVHKLLRLAAEHEREHGRDVRGLVDLANAELEAEARETDAPGRARRRSRRAAHDDPRGQGPGVPASSASPTSGAASPPTRTTCSWPTAGSASGSPASTAPASRRSPTRRCASAPWRPRPPRRTRIAYVALTRAQERLILSGVAPPREVARRDGADGAADRLARARAGPGIDAGIPEEPVREVTWTTPAGGAARPRDGEHARGGRHGAAPPRARRRGGGPARHPSPGARGPGRARARRAGPAADAVLHRAARLEGVRLPLLPRARARPAARARAAAAARRRAPEPAGGIDLRTRGSLVHELLEELDLATGGPWAEGGDPAERLARVHEVADGTT